MSATLCLTGDRAQALYLHMFVVQRRSLEGAPGPVAEAEFLPDTDAHLPAYQRSGWAVTGSWGEAQGGSRWPPRFMVRDVVS